MTSSRPTADAYTRVERAAVVVLLSGAYAVLLSALMVGWYATGDGAWFYPAVAAAIAATAVVGYFKPAAGVFGPLIAALFWALVVAADDDPQAGIGYFAIGLAVVILEAVVVGAWLLRLAVRLIKGRPREPRS